MFPCGRGGIGIRARLRGVSLTGYGFKSRRPHCVTTLISIGDRGCDFFGFMPLCHFVMLCRSVEKGQIICPKKTETDELDHPDAGQFSG